MNLFTSDIDWAPEAVIEDTIGLFNKYGVKCTFFCTHRSSVIDSIKNDPNFELGIHPNFLPILNDKKGSVSEVMEQVLNIIPDAKGIRTHSMVQSTPMLQTFKNYGLTYEANTYLPYWADIKPSKLWNGLVKVPHNFEDDLHFMYGKSFENCELNLEDRKFNVFCIHPIHIFLNTESEETYNNARKHYQNSDELLKLRNTKKKGTRDLLIMLLENHKRLCNNTSLTVFEYLSNNNFFK
jgi:hypothetical protein